MDRLTQLQRNILLDYYFECANPQETKQAKKLLAQHNGAVEFYEKLHHSLSVLDHLDTESKTDCPDHLVEKTLSKLYSHNNQQEQNSSERLENLLKAESEKIVTKRPSFWKNIAEVAAVAAAVVIFSSVFVPVTKNMRAHSNQSACQSNLAKISQGFSQYAGDNAGFMPAVTTKAGSPWWKIGSPQKENHSNTRHLWLLVKKGYLRPEIFLCPGSKSAKPLTAKAQINSLFDFPDRQHISYSFKLICEPNKAVMPKRVSALMADANPIFESCIKRCERTATTNFEPVTLSEKLLRINSRNHRSKGQNVMFSDGTVRFMTVRVLNEKDDIFTVNDLNVYRGTEKPNCEKDTFLVP